MLRFLMKRRWGLFVVLGLILAACGGSATTTTEVATQAPTAQQPANPQPTSQSTNNKLHVGIYAYMTNLIPFDQEVATCKADTGLDIEVLPIPGEESAWQPLTQKIQLAAQNHEAPWDVIYGPTPFIEPGALAKLGLLEPLDAHFPQGFWDDIYEGVLKEIRYTGDGKIYTVPLWTDVFGLIYRPSMLQEAVGTTDPPKSWDDVLQYCKKIDDHYGGKVSCFGADWLWAHRMFIPMMGTYTNQIFNDQGVINFDDPAALKTLQLMKQLYAYMPSNSAESLGSSKTFQANGVAMEIYWQAQLLRATETGVPKNDIAITSFPSGTNSNTLFWSGGAIIPKYSANVEGAVTFIDKCLMSKQSIHDIYNNYKIVPFKSAVSMLQSENALPNWAPPLINLLDVAQAIPSNQYFLTVEQPVFQEEIEKMLVAGQSPEATLANLKQRVQDGLKEVQ
jgi:ABC-type glycerol-3-phosphate transport system substrate-binding protein